MPKARVFLLSSRSAPSRSVHLAMTISVRRAETADADLLSSLNAEIQAIHAAALPLWFKPPGPQSFAPAMTAALLANPDNLLLVADIGSTPVGYVYAEIVRQPETPWRYAYERVYVHQIGVRPSHRRQGAKVSASPCWLRSDPRPSAWTSRSSPSTCGHSMPMRARFFGGRVLRPTTSDSGANRACRWKCSQAKSKKIPLGDRLISACRSTETPPLI